MIKDADIKKTAEWTLLLSSISLPGVFVGAILCNSLGRRNTMILGFSGYLVFGEWSGSYPSPDTSDKEQGLIIGCTYDKITKIIPLFVILCA